MKKEEILSKGKEIGFVSNSLVDLIDSIEKTTDFSVVYSKDMASIYKDDTLYYHLFGFNSEKEIYLELLADKLLFLVTNEYQTERFDLNL